MWNYIDLSVIAIKLSLKSFTVHDNVDNINFMSIKNVYLLKTTERNILYFFLITIYI